MFIDTHCHLDAAEFDVDRDAVAERYRHGNVDCIVVPGVERANFGAVASICREYPECVPAYGIHPMFVDHSREEDLATLRETLAREPSVAVGEIGLDGFVPGRDEALQELFFTEQLKIAREMNLPVILHVRRAVDQVLKHLRRIRVRGGIAHAFNGSREQADEFIKLGFKLGFGGAMTFAGSKRIRSLAAALPLDAIVLETDSPHIPPQWLDGGRNEPAELSRIAAVLAELRNTTTAAIANATADNAMVALPGLAARRSFTLFSPTQRSSS
jgi:TatD DNase family protein